MRLIHFLAHDISNIGGNMQFLILLQMLNRCGIKSATFFLRPVSSQHVSARIVIRVGMIILKMPLKLIITDSFSEDISRGLNTNDGVSVSTIIIHTNTGKVLIAIAFLIAGVVSSKVLKEYNLAITARFFLRHCVLAQETKE